jgi:hypothetical protein
MGGTLLLLPLQATKTLLNREMSREYSSDSFFQANSDPILHEGLPTFERLHGGVRRQPVLLTFS